MQRKLQLFSLILLFSLLTGCAFGPTVLRHERGSYNTVVAKTADEQMLINLVHIRYNERAAFLEISGITTSRHASVNANYNYLYSLSRLSNLVTAGGEEISRTHDTTTLTQNSISPGFSYDESPTFTYLPLQGTAFAQRMLTPIGLPLIYILARSDWDLNDLLRILVESMNGVVNTMGSSSPTQTYLSREKTFGQVAGVFQKLNEEHALLFTYEPADKTGLVNIIIDPRYMNSPQVHFLQKELHIKTRKNHWLVATYSQNVNADIYVETRSLMGVFYYLADAVQVPQSDMERGLVTVTRTENGEIFDWSQVFRDLLTIKSSVGLPSNASTITRYRGKWFYIEDSDVKSKETLVLLGQLFDLTAGEVSPNNPVLTVSV